MKLNRKRILLVEDDLNFGNMLKEYLLINNYDIILAKNGIEGFQTTIQGYSANDTIMVDVQHQNGSFESVELVLSDKYDYYSELGWSSENLEAIGIEQGDAFLGVEGISESTSGIDRLAGPFSPRFEGGIVAQIIYTPLHILQMVILPFEMQGVSMHPVQEAMLVPTDSIISDTLGIAGLLFLVNFFFNC